MLRTLKVIVLWFLCIGSGLLLLAFIPKFRLLSPLRGTGTAAALGSAAAAIIFLLFLIGVFIVLLRTALSATKAR
jgi:hypothetical protein